MGPFQGACSLFQGSFEGLQFGGDALGSLMALEGSFKGPPWGSGVKRPSDIILFRVHGCSFGPQRPFNSSRGILRFAVNLFRGTRLLKTPTWSFSTGSKIPFRWIVCGSLSRGIVAFTRITITLYFVFIYLHMPGPDILCLSCILTA